MKSICCAEGKKIMCYKVFGGHIMTFYDFLKVEILLDAKNCQRA